MELLEKLLNLGDEVKNAAPFSERVMMGLETALLGMGVIFSVLIILWAVLSVFKLIFYRPAKTEKKAEAQPVTAEAAQVQAADSATEINDEELVAVITAAIAAMTDKPATSFKVVSFRRTASK